MVPQVDLIFFGGSRSEATEVLPGLSVVYRTLTTREQIEVLESGARYRDSDAKSLTLQINTLARALVALNGAPLTLDTAEKEALKKNLGRDPTPVDEAVAFLADHVAPHYLAALDKAYMDFYMSQLTQYEELKKKLSEPSTGESTPP